MDSITSKPCLLSHVLLLINEKLLRITNFDYLFEILNSKFENLKICFEFCKLTKIISIKKNNRTVEMMKTNHTRKRNSSPVDTNKTTNHQQTSRPMTSSTNSSNSDLPPRFIQYPDLISGQDRG